MTSDRLRLLVPLAAFSALCALTARPPGPSPELQRLPPLLPRIELLRTVGAPVLALVTDFYWIETIQAVGVARTQEEYRQIGDYAMLVTDLDPSFRQVYAFAGVVMPFPVGRGRWANTKESTRLLERGIEHFPDNAYLHILLAYNLTHYDRDYRHAADVLASAARIPGAPRYLGPLATRLYARSGQFDAGLELARNLAEDSEDPETRETFRERVLELELERELDLVEAAATRYRQREGRLPSAVADLIRAGDLTAVPVDPLGGEIVLHPDGHAFSTAQARRLSDLGEQASGNPQGAGEAAP